MTAHKGKCFCGAVEIEVQGDPAGMGYCHCSSCRSWSASPVNAFTLWPPQQVKVTRGAEHLGRFRKTDIRGNAVEYRYHRDVSKDSAERLFGFLRNVLEGKR